MARGGKKRGSAKGGRRSDQARNAPEKLRRSGEEEKEKSSSRAVADRELAYWLRVFEPETADDGADESGTVAADAAEQNDDEILWAQMARSVQPLWPEERRQEAAGRPGSKAGEKPAKPAAAEKSQADLSLLEKLLRQGRRAEKKAAAPPAHPGLGLDRRSDLKLKRGRMEIEDRLDLHGLNRAQAYERLQRFIIRAQARELRCVLVITGKGRAGTEGVLKREVPEWLSEAPLRDLVLRFYRAQPQDGGSGALYILLRRLR